MIPKGRTLPGGMCEINSDQLRTSILQVNAVIKQQQWNGIIASHIREYIYH